MGVLKKIGSWIAASIAVIVIAYNFFNGWLINSSQPRLYEDRGKLWVAEPSSPFMHYLFGSEITREARQNPATGQYEFKKDGLWIPLANEM